MQKIHDLQGFKKGDLVRFSCFERFTFEIKRDQISSDDYIIPVSATLKKPYASFSVTLPAPQEDILFHYSNSYKKWIIVASGRKPMFSDDLIIIFSNKKTEE